MLLDLRRRARRAIAERALEIGVREALDVSDDAAVLRLPRRPQRREIVVEDRVELLRLVAFAGEAMHPDAVAEQQVVERPVQRAEEGAAVGAVVGVRDLRRRAVQPLVHPGVVGRQHFELRLHAHRPPLQPIP